MGWVAKALLRLPYPGNDSVSIVQDGRWARAENLAPTGVRPPYPPRSVAIPAHLSTVTKGLISAVQFCSVCQCVCVCVCACGAGSDIRNRSATAIAP